MKKIFPSFSLILACLALSSCDFGLQEMDASEYGVKFNALPGFLGGGLAEKQLVPGEVEIVWPWQSIYKLDTSVQEIAWGPVGQGTDKSVEDLVETRGIDGNEVGLSIIVQYQVNPDKVRHVIQYVGVTIEDINRLVTAVARADIRTHFNKLQTLEFFNPVERQRVVRQLEEAMRERLEPEGINVVAVIYKDHQFERRLPDGTYDRSYQEQIDKQQAISEQTEQEKKKIAVVTEQKRREFNEEQARVNRVIEAAEGEKRQAHIRGDAYLEAKKNESEAIRALGLAKVEGLKKQIAALKGEGGRALLRLSVAEELIKNDPRFVVVNAGSGNSNLDISRVDANELVNQAGLFEAAKEGLTKQPTKPGRAEKLPSKEQR